MPKLIICRGIPGCGKSTYTRQMVAEAGGQLTRICKDELRLMLHQTHKWGLEKMDFYNDVITAMWEQCLANGYDVVLDETFMRVSDCERVAMTYKSLCAYYRDTVHPFIPEFEVLDFTQIPFEEVVRRDAGRHPSLGYAVLDEYRVALEREGDTCSIMASLQESSGLSIKVTTCSSAPRLPSAVA